MRRSVRLAVGALAVGGSALLGVQPAAAQTVDCTDEEVAAAYSDQCVLDDEVDDGDDSGNDDDGGVAGGSGGGGSLPFTGDEVLILSLAGAGALAVGTGLVVAGRRRGSKTA